MKNFRKILLVLVMVLSIVFVASCDNNKHEHEYVDGKCECGETDPNYVAPIDQLANQMEELKTASATINCPMAMELKLTMGTESQTQKMSADMYIELDPTSTYSITTAEGEKQYSYALIQGEYVKEYVKLEEEWILADTVSVNDYSSNNDLYDIDVKESFTLVDGIWIGDTVLLSQALKSSMDEIATELGGLSGVTIDETTIKKYNITVENGKISLIDIEMYMKMSYQGMIMEISYAMPMNLSKIGETTVTVPEGLPVE